jgi:hypothetical protein
VGVYQGVAGGGGGGFGGGGGSAKNYPGTGCRANWGGGGGGLGYKNNYPVTPGASIPVIVGRGGYAPAVSNTPANGQSGTGASGAVRILWPGTRQFPTTCVGNP